MESSTDAMTRSTADDALAGKSAARGLGYTSDPFVTCMLGKSQGAMAKSLRKRQPLINRGYYARVEVIRNRFEDFVRKLGETQLQVVNLGVGFDTLSLDLLQHCQTSGRKMAIYEVDFIDVVKRKAEYILSDPLLRSPLFPNDDTSTNTSANKASVFTQINNNDVQNSGYHEHTRDLSSSSRISWSSTGNTVHGVIGSTNPLYLLGCDLRKAEDVTLALRASGFDPTIPTAIISECTLVYIESRYAFALCAALGNLLDANTPAIWISYDMTHSQDTYGKVMLRNLTNAGFKVPSFTQLPTLASHKLLFEEAGWGDPLSRKRGSSDPGVSNWTEPRLGRQLAPLAPMISKTLLPIMQVAEEDSEADDDEKGKSIPSDQTLHESANLVEIKPALKEHGGMLMDMHSAPEVSREVCHAFGAVETITMLQAWERLISSEEKTRVSKLELFDELEEWNMLMSHYCLTTAARNCIIFDSQR